MLVHVVVLRIDGFGFLVAMVVFRSLMRGILFILVVLVFVGRVYCGVGECSQAFLLRLVRHRDRLGTRDRLRQ